VFYLSALLIAQEHMYPGSILEGLGSNAVNISMSIVILTIITGSAVLWNAFVDRVRLNAMNG
jgi:hypothetical protein